MSIQKLFFLICIIPLALTATTLKELTNKYKSEQKVIFIPISVGGITIIIPAGSGLPPNPGEAGNRDIRHDVERHISLHFQNKPKARAYAYIIIVQKYQQLIENLDMPLSQQQALIIDISQASDCINKKVDYGSHFTMPLMYSIQKQEV